VLPIMFFPRCAISYGNLPESAANHVFPT
jgi:hypothetical protein